MNRSNKPTERKIKLDVTTTDYIAVNGLSVAKIMRGTKTYQQEKVFRSGVFRLGRLSRLLAFVARSVIFRIPVQKTRGDQLRFQEPVSVELHAEGEYERFDGVSKIEVRKTKRPLKVIQF